MLLKISTLLAGLVSSISAASSSKECVASPQDPQAPLRAAAPDLSVMNIVYDDVFGEQGWVQKALAYFPDSTSKCLANYNGDKLMELMPIVMSPICMKAISSFNHNARWREDRRM